MLRKWGSVATGVLLALPTLWQGIEWVLRWGEHVEFVSARVKDIAHAGPMLVYLDYVPPWLGTALILPASLAIWWGLRKPVSLRADANVTAVGSNESTGPADRIPLQVAAAELFGKIGDTKFGKATADRCISEEEIWNAIGTMLVNRGEVWGRQYGANQPTKLRSSDKRYGSVVGGARELREKSAEKKTIFTDLSLARSELNRITAYVETHAGEWGA